jgi:hypothetical protein
VRRAAITFGITGLALIVSGLVIFRDVSLRPSPAPEPAAAPAPAPVVAELPSRAIAIWDLPATIRPERPAIVPNRSAAPPVAPVAAAILTATPFPITAAPVGGTLHIVSDIPGAQVFLDRQFIGATPVTANDVPPGSHQLNVSAQGYDNHVQTIEVSPGSRDIMITFRVVRLNASIEVVHKHLMGSCRGRLVATPKGLRYETTDDDDAFGATLLDLETFHVDYLNKSLRLQPRKGKRYDFTDPQGNADRLLIFHRDVERARERLKRGDVPSTE